MYTDDFTELIPDVVQKGLKSGLEKELKVYLQDSQGEYREVSHVSEVNLTPIFDDFIGDMERIFGKKDYKAERKKWIKRFRKSGKM